MTVLVAGEKPIQQDEVAKEISNRTRDILNIDLHLVYIGWGDYINQVRLNRLLRSFKLNER